MQGQSPIRGEEASSFGIHFLYLLITPLEKKKDYYEVFENLGEVINKVLICKMQIDCMPQRARVLESDTFSV